MGPGRPLTVGAWFGLLSLTAAPLLVGFAAGIVLDAAGQLRTIRRTGHVRDCPGLRGWPCDCRDSEPEPGTLGQRDHGAGSAAGLLLLPDAGPPAEGDRARLPGLRFAGRTVHPSPTRH